MSAPEYFKSNAPTEWSAQQFCEALTSEGANCYIERESAEPIVRLRAFPKASLSLELDSSECVAAVRLEWPFLDYEHHFYESIAGKIQALEFYPQS